MNRRFMFRQRKKLFGERTLKEKMLFWKVFYKEYLAVVYEDEIEYPNAPLEEVIFCSTPFCVADYKEKM